MEGKILGRKQSSGTRARRLAVTDGGKMTHARTHARTRGRISAVRSRDSHCWSFAYQRRWRIACICTCMQRPSTSTRGCAREGHTTRWATHSGGHIQRPPLMHAAWYARNVECMQRIWQAVTVRKTYCV
eukprot:2705677-Pleurochrysis_carterae.AAC.5